MNTKDTIWTEETIIQPYQADFQGRWKPSSFFRAMQTAASHSAESLGFGYHNMMESGMAWVLSRVMIQFYAFPQIDDTVTIKTWPKTVERKIWFLRDFEMFSANGARLAAATSTWLLIDINNVRLMTEQKLPFQMPDNSHRNALQDIPDRIAIETERHEQFSVTTRYSDIDIMGHVNNARYVDWVTDCFPLDIFNQNKLYRLQINYIKEVKFGNRISVSTGKDRNNPDQWLIIGDNQSSGAIAFEAAVIWST